MSKSSTVERPRELQLPVVPKVTVDSDDDSPSRHVRALVRRFEDKQEQVVQDDRPRRRSGQRLSDVRLRDAANDYDQQLASPQSTSSGQDAALYAEPTIDDDADRRSTDTEASDRAARSQRASVADGQGSDLGKQPVNGNHQNLAASSNDVNSASESERPSVATIDDGASATECSEEEKRERKLRNIVQEIVDAERTYVSKLELIHNGFYEEFRERNRREQAAGGRPLVGEDTLQKVFRNVREIWRFHADTLLPALSNCVTGQSPARVGAVLKKFAPFFKMYTEYTTNYDADMRLLNAELKRNERFAQLLAELQRQPSCCMLTLQQHMLGPIQRIPRYELLLSSYLKQLAADDSDRMDAELALKLVREAVQKGEMRMKGSEEFKRMLELGEIFAKDVSDLIQPTRTLVKEGKVLKVSARNENEKAERYLFLFNDLLLVCAQIPFSPSEAYKLHGSPLNTSGMDVRVLSPADAPAFAFQPSGSAFPTSRIALKTTQRHIEFAFDDPEDRADWLTAFQNAARSRVSLASHSAASKSGLPFVPGREAPKWVRDSEATMCMVCAATFTAVINRRHHCRSCGSLICSACSQERIPLFYTGDLSKPQRVCRPCFDLHRAISSQNGQVSLRVDTISSTSSTSRLSAGDMDDRLSVQNAADGELSTNMQMVVQRRLSTVSNASQGGPPGRRLSSAEAGNPRRDAAGDPALLKAYALISFDHGRSWERRFLAVRDDFAIYIYRAHADIHTRETIPLPGYKVNKMKEKERVNAFKLSHPSGHVNSWLIQLNDPSLFIMWIEALEHLVCARLPPNASLST